MDDSLGLEAPTAWLLRAINASPNPCHSTTELIAVTTPANALPASCDVPKCPSRAMEVMSHEILQKMERAWGTAAWRIRRWMERWGRGEGRRGEFRGEEDDDGSSMLGL
mmetsp:Transcript_19097/g.39776  ORF Transcript_19097/g.39776 Transcript_19097/m.39776 type:complete len:109 (+) Transcript_19097:303-629(+)